MQELTFSDRLNMALTRAGVPHGPQRVKEASKLLEASREATRQWLNGEVKPRLTSIHRISERLHVNPHWLLDGQGSMLNGHDLAREAFSPRPQAELDRGDTPALTGWPAHAEKLLQVIVAAVAGFILGTGLLKTLEIVAMGEPLCG